MTENDREAISTSIRKRWYAYLDKLIEAVGYTTDGALLGRIERLLDDMHYRYVLAEEDSIEEEEIQLEEPAAPVVTAENSEEFFEEVVGSDQEPAEIPAANSEPAPEYPLGNLHVWRDSRVQSRLSLLKSNKRVPELVRIFYNATEPLSNKEIKALVSSNKTNLSTLLYDCSTIHKIIEKDDNGLWQFSKRGLDLFLPDANHPEKSWAERASAPLVEAEE